MDKQNSTHTHTHTHTHEYYSALKKERYSVNLKDMILSEIIQLQKDKYCMIPLRVVKIIKTENRIRLARGQSREEWKVIGIVRFTR